MKPTHELVRIAAAFLFACAAGAFSLDIVAAAEPSAKDGPPASDGGAKKPVAVAAPAPKPRPKEIISQETAAGPAAAEEIKKLIGSWQVVEEIQENEQAARILKLVVTPKTFYFADTGSSYPLLFRYRLDVSKTPKQLDLHYATRLDLEYAKQGEELAANFQDPLPAIYELNGDTLRLSFGERDDSGDKWLRPEAYKVEPKPKRELRVWKRCSDAAVLPLRTAKEVDAEILKALDGWIALLEAKEYRKFYDAATARPDQFVTIGMRTSTYDEVLPTLCAVKRLIPTMSDGGTRAVYDLTEYHIEGVETVVFMKLSLVRKNNEGWKLEGI